MLFFFFPIPPHKSLHYIFHKWNDFIHHSVKWTIIHKPRSRSQRIRSQTCSNARNGFWWWKKKYIMDKKMSHKAGNYSPTFMQEKWNLNTIISSLPGVSPKIYHKHMGIWILQVLIRENENVSLANNISPPESLCTGKILWSINASNSKQWKTDMWRKLLYHTRICIIIYSYFHICSHMQDNFIQIIPSK